MENSFKTVVLEQIKSVLNPNNPILSENMKKVIRSEDTDTVVTAVAKFTDNVNIFNETELSTLLKMLFYVKYLKTDISTL